MKKVRLGSGSAYWGDMLEPAIELAEKGNLDYLGFDHLAELTMSILQRMRTKDPTKGYIPDVLPFMRKLLPIAVKNKVKLITNGGGANPEAAADEVVKIARELGFKGLKIGVVTGDDILHRLDDILAKGIVLRNLDTGEEDISRIKDRIVAANAYTGADSIIDALKAGADVVIAGRVSDNALYVAPLMYEFGWEFADGYWDKIGAAITVGHIIECAECCTGGASNMWKQAPELWRIGFPIAEVDENGNAVITKVPGSGGLINQWTIKEHLVYEVHDPANYLMPDGIADFTALKIEEIGKDQVKVTNMKGKPRPTHLKVQIGYKEGFVAEGIVILPWPDAYEKAKQAEQVVRGRLEVVGVKPQEIRFDYIGINALHGPVAPEPTGELNEVGLRVAARCNTFEEADKVRREVTHLWTLAGVGSSFGAPIPVRQIIGLWPTLIPREEIPTQFMIKEVD